MRCGTKTHQCSEQATSISTSHAESRDSHHNGCQCPERATSISTDTKCTDSPIQGVVSMPWTGNIHFYKRAKRKEPHGKFGVNALNGQHPFLRSALDYMFGSVTCVSMPWTGNIHFYRNSANTQHKGGIIVSMPWTGNIHFYKSLWMTGCASTTTCQCPERATSISTLTQ